MSKTGQRKLTMYQEGRKDALDGWARPRWIRHPLKSCYMAGWYSVKKKEQPEKGIIRRLRAALSEDA